MGVIEPRGKRGGAYFGCGGAACLGLFFWAIVAGCLLLTLAGLSTELDSDNTELISAFYALSQITAGSLAFCFSMASIIVVFIGFGVFQRTRKFVAHGNDHDLNTVLLFFFLFVGGMLLAAALPTVALEYPGSNLWIKATGIISGGAYLLFGMLMLWLTLAAYESYRLAGEGELQ